MLRFALLVGGAALCGLAGPASGQTYDVLITGGDVVDGTGSARFRADVAISGDRIVAVSRHTGSTSMLARQASRICVSRSTRCPVSRTSLTTPSIA